MQVERLKSPLWVDVAVVVSMGAVLASDSMTPLGTADWVLFLVPIGLAALSRRPWMPAVTNVIVLGLLVAGYYLSPPSPIPSTLAVLNRWLGAIAMSCFAVMSHYIVRSRIAEIRRSWVRDTIASVRNVLVGEKSVSGLATDTLNELTARLGAPAGAMWTFDDAGRPTRSATTGIVTDAPASADGLVATAARARDVVTVTNVPPAYMKVGSGLGEHDVASLLLAPARADDRLEAVIELGFFGARDEAIAEVLSGVAEPVAVAMRTATYRARQQALLEETVRQTEELQSQQEELATTNEELRSQGETLREAQAELEATNAELEQQQNALAEQNSELARMKDAVQSRADEVQTASRYKSEFLANMSHELRTPLNSALILAKLLADNKEGNLTEEQIRFARTIHDAGSDLLVLINDILDLSRIEAGRLEVRRETVVVKRLVASLEATFRPLADEKGLTLALDVDSDVADAIETDGLRAGQILKNLLSNAIKFTERGGVRLHVAKSGPNVRFDVTDTGVGIAVEHRDAVFEVFRQVDGGSTRRHGGSGLGLAISRDLARLLGGDVSLESAPGKGSTFTVVLPVAWPNGAASATPRREGARSSAPKLRESSPGVRSGDVSGGARPRTALVVEDDETFAELLADVARERGFEPRIAATADAAIAACEASVPDAVLLDIGLPDHTGLTVLDRLKHGARTRHVPVHVVSGEPDAEASLEMGAVGWLAKPVTRTDLLAAFEKLERRLANRVKRVLVVEDDAVQQEAILALLAGDDVENVPVGTVAAALDALAKETFDCVVMDLSLPDGSGFDLLERLSERDGSFPPVIVYTGRALSLEEEDRLSRFSRSIIVKGARSPERLLDEVTLFLHRVESTLPRARQAMLRDARNREDAFDGKKILVAEDDVRNVFALTSIFEPKGAKVLIARNGKQALDLLEREDVDLVLMDIMMPEMDGLEATRRIRQNPKWSRLPVIALTAKAMKDDRERCREAGANDYVAKPLDVDKLVSLVRVWLRR